MKKIYCMALVMSLLSACMTVNSISTSPIPPAAARKNKITASASNFVFLAIPFGNSFVERAREGLERQCPKGYIEGILSKHQDTNYFLGLAGIQEVVMEGYCLTPLKKG